MPPPEAPVISTWRKELELVRQRGYSIDRGTYSPGVTIVAAPVLDSHGRLTHTLVVTGVAVLARIAAFELAPLGASQSDANYVNAAACAVAMVTGIAVALLAQRAEEYM